MFSVAKRTANHLRVDVFKEKFGHWDWRGRMDGCVVLTVDHRVFVQLEEFRFGWGNQGKEGSQNILTTKVVVEGVVLRGLRY